MFVLPGGGVDLKLGETYIYRSGNEPPSDYRLLAGLQWIS
jgi:hypothetical protein